MNWALTINLITANLARLGLSLGFGLWPPAQQAELSDEVELIANTPMFHDFADRGSTTEYGGQTKPQEQMILGGRSRRLAG